MTITVDPILVSFGATAIRWYGLLALLGLALAVALSLHALERERLGRRMALDGLAWALPAGVLGARLVHVVGAWDYYLTNSAELWQLNLDGLSLWGGLAAGGLIFAARIGRGGVMRQRRILDVVTPYALLGISIGRIGEFLDGQGQGVPSDLPWATQYSSTLAATPDFGMARQPAQLYDALIACALFGLLWVLPRGMPAGCRTAVALIAYAAARVALGTIRLDAAFVFGLQIEQLLALGAIVLGLAFGLRVLLETCRGAHYGAQREGVAAKVAAAPEDSLAA